MKQTIRPPKGFRIMRNGEKPDVRKGDVVFIYGSGWTTTAYDGSRTARQLMDRPVIQAYARKIKRKASQ
jgi:hypothetical protein